MDPTVIGALGAIASPEQVAIAQLAPAAPAGGFGDWFAQQVGAVDHSLTVATQDARALATGQAQSLHEVMIHMEEARLSFQLLAQVRNHVLEAYQEVMRMQV